LIDICLGRGEEMLLRKEITTEAALSGPLFATALRLARYRALLDADDSEAGTRREQFAAEVERTLAAINELQDVYDRSLQEPAIRHVHETRSIA
jgi:glycerol-3-phosphate O-acyltransferase